MIRPLDYGLKALSNNASTGTLELGPALFALVGNEPERAPYVELWVSHYDDTVSYGHLHIPAGESVESNFIGSS